MTNNNAARLLPALGIAITLAVCQHGFGAAAVFGSFQRVENAERLRAEMATEPGVGTRVVAVSGNNGRVYRVVSAAVDEAQARALARISHHLLKKAVSCAINVLFIKQLAQGGARPYGDGVYGIEVSVRSSRDG